MGEPPVKALFGFDFSTIERDPLSLCWPLNQIENGSKSPVLSSSTFIPAC